LVKAPAAATDDDDADDGDDTEGRESGCECSDTGVMALEPRPLPPRLCRADSTDEECDGSTPTDERAPAAAAVAMGAWTRLPVAERRNSVGMATGTPGTRLREEDAEDDEGEGAGGAVPAPAPTVKPESVWLALTLRRRESAAACDAAMLCAIASAVNTDPLRSRSGGGAPQLPPEASRAAARSRSSSSKFANSLVLVLAPNPGCTNCGEETGEAKSTAEVGEADGEGKRCGECAGSR
jgi:hypothetical protein